MRIPASRIRHGVRTTEYAGFTLVYRRRNSLVANIESLGYELEALRSSEFVARPE